MKQLHCTLCLFCALRLHAQNIEKTTLNFTTTAITQTTLIPFHAVQAIDARFDRSNIGFLNKVTKATSSRIKYVQTLASFPDSLHNYLLQLLQKLITFDP